MSITIKLAVLAVLGAATVASVRLLILPGLNIVSINLRFGSKARGQILGYATSLPELVVVISSAAAGVFDAGFWNIASSNIINWVLFLSAIFTYRQHHELAAKMFIDELIFGVVSVALPLGLFVMSAQTSIPLAGVLLLMFGLYRYLDYKVNDKPVAEKEEHAQRGARPTWLGIVILFAGVVAISVTGKFLGATAEDLVDDLQISAWLIGWVLGFITSIPEMSSFFLVYKVHKRQGKAHKLDDTQEALDALVSSNMSNLGIILPVGILIAALI
ncbi:MAG: hypothetical protein GF398_07740 [Chitinivibrionales bacterium]|nr:hypothetical protein [Chitinivibrionales bacterium]